MKAIQMKDIRPEGRKKEEGTKIKKQNTINRMFANQQLRAINNLEKEVLKEERLATKKRLEIKWKEMKAHSMRKRWAEEWIDEKVLDRVIPMGSQKVNIRVNHLVMDLVDHSTKLGEVRRSMLLEIKKEGRLKEARSKKEKLLMYLDRWWTTLEGGGSQI